jgi:hypothetical protein
MRLIAAILFAAGLPLATAAMAMMPPWAYEEALMTANTEAVLSDLDIRFDADNRECSIAGTVREVRPRAGTRSDHYPRRRKLTEQPLGLAGQQGPAIGARLALTLACFRADAGGAEIGGRYQFPFEALSQARQLLVPVDGNGRVVNAHGAGVSFDD